MSGPNEVVAQAVLKAHLGRVLRYEYVVPGSLVRADAIDVSLESLDGWEIKTAVDSTKRLAGQVHGYQRYFDRCWLLAAPGHAKVELPPWWGLVSFEAERFPEYDWRNGPDGYAEYQQRLQEVVQTATVTVVREASPNPRQEERPLWDALWAGEARAVLAVLFGNYPRSAWHYDRIIGRLSIEQLRTLARWTLVNRDPSQYPFTKARMRLWTAQVAELLGLDWQPPASDPEAPQPSLFEGVLA
jgi:hypothetical protein